jgi:hypothetical protein
MVRWRIAKVIVATPAIRFRSEMIGLPSIIAFA